MAANDIKITQEQSDGSLKQLILPADGSASAAIAAVFASLGAGTAGASVLQAETEHEARGAIGAADDAAVVKLVGDQTITGDKTFAGDVTIGSGPGNDFTVLDDDPRFPNVTAATVAASDGKVALNREAGDARYLSRIPNDNDTAPLAFLMASRPELRFGTTFQFANSGWNDWSAVNNTSWVQLRLPQPPSSASGWARAGNQNFLLRLGEAVATPASRGFSFGAWTNFPAAYASIGMRTDIYFGVQLNETGGPLTARGLRVSFLGNEPTSAYRVEAAIHNGINEVVGYANVATSSFLNGIVVRWMPINIVSGKPGVGSRLELWGRSNAGILSRMTYAELTSAFDVAIFAGSSWAVVGSSSATLPGYTVFWELGGIGIYLH